MSEMVGEFSIFSIFSSIGSGQKKSSFGRPPTPVKPTIKEVGKDGMVIRTLERARLWEVQSDPLFASAVARGGAGAGPVVLPSFAKMY